MEPFIQKKKNKLKIQDIALLGLMTATISVGKMALSFLPNVEIVTFLILIYTLFFGGKVLFSVFAFVLIEIFTYGLGIWTIMYLYIWPLLSILVLLFKKHQHILFWSIFSGLFGLSFGALCSIPYLFIGGPVMLYTWWLSGLPWDVLHGVSNFILCLILFLPFSLLFKKLRIQFPQFFADIKNSSLRKD